MARLKETDPAVLSARKLLEERGYTVLRSKSYQALQERVRVAEALRAWADEKYEHISEWAQGYLCKENRRLSDRLTFVYGVARAHGASVEELNGSL